MGDKETQRIVIDMLVDDLKETPVVLVSALERGDLDELAVVSHRFKSSLMYLGNSQIIQENAIIEQLALDQSKEKEAIRAHLNKLQLLISPVRRELLEIHQEISR